MQKQSTHTLTQLFYTSMDIYIILAGATIAKTTKRIGTVESASIYQKLLMSNGTVHTTNGILE